MATQGSITGDTTSITHKLDGSESGEDVTIVVNGTWSGVTVAVQLQANNTWVTLESYTANFSKVFRLAVGANIRLNVSGSGSPLPSLTYWMA